LDSQGPNFLVLNHICLEKIYVNIQGLDLYQIEIQEVDDFSFVVNYVFFCVYLIAKVNQLFNIRRRNIFKFTGDKKGCYPQQLKPGPCDYLLGENSVENSHCHE
jgi:hypothetical protein